MKKLLIVNRNLEIGGIQKALVNMLQAIAGEYDITLLLFKKNDTLQKIVPSNVKIVTASKLYEILSLDRQALKKQKGKFFLKVFFLGITKIFNKRFALRLMGITQKKIKGFDVAISYSHLTHYKDFADGTAEFVLDKVDAKEKICFIHCDYAQSNTFCKQNNRLYSKFDKIACCSHSVKGQFLLKAPTLSNRVVVVRNFFDLSIDSLSKEFRVEWDNRCIHIVTVARLSAEKGISRAINALHDANRSDICFHIVGKGPEEGALRDLVNNLDMGQHVIFEGEQANPYPYMKGADYLLLSSYHEAAPMVFDEAKLIGTPIIATETLSAKEMIGEDGIVCDNNESALMAIFQKLEKKDKANGQQKFSNENQLKQFAELLNREVIHEK